MRPGPRGSTGSTSQGCSTSSVLDRTGGWSSRARDSSLIAGEIQYSVGGGDSVIRSALRGADTVLVASPLKTGLQRLMVRPDIKTPAELKNKKIGITRFGSASHWVLQLFLRKWGMRSEDIQKWGMRSEDIQMVQ